MSLNLEKINEKVAWGPQRSIRRKSSECSNYPSRSCKRGYNIRWHSLLNNNEQNNGIRDDGVHIHCSKIHIFWQIDVQLMINMLRGVHLTDHLKFPSCGVHANMFIVSYQENHVKIMIFPNIFLCWRKHNILVMIWE